MRVRVRVDACIISSPKSSSLSLALWRWCSYDGPLTDKLYDAFEELFTKGDGLMLMFEQLSGQDVNTILLDCLM